MLTKARGYAALAATAVLLAVMDVGQRFVLGPLVRMLPKRRHNMLVKWIKATAWATLGVFRRIGVISMAPPPSVPGRAGVLVVMNHQSIWDIPIMVSAVQDNFIRIVTRMRYLRTYIPVISHMVRLYEFPVVDPGARGRELRKILKGLRRAAESDDAPLGIFPEGTRSRDGEIGRFRTAGMKLILRARPWQVHILVTDGLWKRARFSHLLSAPERVAARVEHAGVVEWRDPRAETAPFIEEIRRRMSEKLVEMRAAA